MGFKKLMDMAKDSYKEQKGVSRAIEGKDELEDRARRIEERGRKQPGIDGVFGAAESVHAAANQQWVPSGDYDDKVNKTLTALSEKLTGETFVVSGEGRATEWPQGREAVIAMTNQRIVVMRKGKRFTDEDVLFEVPKDELASVDAVVNLKGQKLRFSFTDGSAIEVPVENTKADAFEMKWKTKVR